MDSKHAEALEAREFLRSRILEQGRREGAPLTELEIEILDSDHLPNERELVRGFFKEHDFQKYMERIGGLLRRARDREIEGDLDVGEAYNRMSARLQKSQEDFTLFACAVMGLGSDASGEVALSSYVYYLVFVLVVLTAGLGLGYLLTR